MRKLLLVLICVLTVLNSWGSICFAQEPKVELPTWQDFEDDKTVTAEIEKAWDDSKKSEQGGWIYQNLTTGELLVVRIGTGTYKDIDVPYPLPMEGYRAVGFFHTHPQEFNKKAGPSELDLARTLFVPELVKDFAGLHPFGPARGEYPSDSLPAAYVSPMSSSFTPGKTPMTPLVGYYKNYWGQLIDSQQFRIEWHLRDKQAGDYVLISKEPTLTEEAFLKAINSKPGCYVVLMAIFDKKTGKQVDYDKAVIEVLEDRPVSPYDGKYTGTFNYEYVEWVFDRKYVNPDLTYRNNYVQAEPVSKSLTVSVTFKTRPSDIPFYEEVEDFSQHGTWLLDITAVNVNDQRFDTGAIGITPINNAQRRSEASLPSDAETAVSLMDTNTNLDISFPNGASLHLIGVDVGFAEWTLSGENWSAYVPGMKGPFSEEKLADPDYAQTTRYRAYGTSWSLKKVPSRINSKEVRGGDGKDLTGDVQIRKGGEGDWGQYYQTGLSSGDEIKTVNSSKAVIYTPDDDKVTLKPNSGLTIKEWAAEGNYSFELSGGELHAQVEEAERTFEVSTPAAVASARGTEFTVQTNGDGSTTVMVFDGAVSVTDVTSNEGIILMTKQAVTIPAAVGLTQEEMLGRVTTTPRAPDIWWEEELGHEEEMEGSFAVGNFNIISGSRLTAEGFIFAFTALAAIFFLAVGRLFAYRLRRLSKRM
jgi:hypothetical protein